MTCCLISRLECGNDFALSTSRWWTAARPDTPCCSDWNDHTPTGRLTLAQRHVPPTVDPPCEHPRLEDCQALRAAEGLHGRRSDAASATPLLRRHRAERPVAASGR